MSIFHWFKRKKKQNIDKSLPSTEDRTKVVIADCEKMVNLCKDYELSKDEYRFVTDCLQDVEKIERLQNDEYKKLYEAASNVVRLNQAREQYIKMEQKITDSQFSKLQEMEKDIPKSIKRLNENEKSLNALERDLKKLEGEKLALDITKDECKKMKQKLRLSAIFIMTSYLFVMLLLIILAIVSKYDIRFWAILATFLATAFFSYIVLSFQTNAKKYRKADVNKNHAISLENHIKIRYVNMKNAVDYAYEKYHVRNAKDFEYQYECYIEAVREREKFLHTSEELEYYNQKLAGLIEKFHFHDPKMWLGNPESMIDKKNLVEMKHDLLARRQKLRMRMESAEVSVCEMQVEIERELSVFDEENRGQVEEILRRTKIILES